MIVVLKGMTWNHPRGYDPMVACSQSWQEKTGVEIRWEKRSLQDFEAFPVETLARNYDLIVIDHPHVGQITGENCLLPLDVPVARRSGRRSRRQASARPIGATRGMNANGPFRSTPRPRCRPGGQIGRIALRHGGRCSRSRVAAASSCRSGLRIR